MNEFLDWQLEDGVVTLTMNHPGERNALSGEQQFSAFEDACTRINSDRSIRAAVLTGKGSAFCAGGNVKDIVARAGMFGGSPPEVRNNYRAGIHRIPLAIESLEVPIIAAVNGPALGAGCDLACMCDIRIASELAVFGEIFVTLGLIPGDGGCWFLQRCVSYSNAAEMVLTGEPITASRAAAIGLVSKVCEPAALLADAQALARRIATNDSGAVRMAKVLLRHARETSLAAALEMAAAFQSIAHHGDGHEAALKTIAARQR
jgi:enoyl-CoA hydratase/carnithine racemase